MSFFGGLIKDVHTFASWVERELAKLYGEAPKIEAIAGAVLKYAGPALQTVVSLEAGTAAGAIVGSVVKQAQSDLIVAGSLVHDFGATPSAGTVISSVQDNLSGLLAAGHISNPTSVATVTKVTGELGALVTAFPTATATATAAA
ncbi:MAG: hypothetical protein ACYCSP_06010 [Acidobacteriaceae bacterium]